MPMALRPHLHVYYNVNPAGFQAKIGGLCRAFFALQRCKGMGFFLYSCAVLFVGGGKRCYNNILKEDTMHETVSYTRWHGGYFGGFDGWVWGWQ